MKTLDIEKQVEILTNPLKIKKLISKNGGIYDDCHNWISVSSGKIAGVIKLKSGVCSILFKTECQSINVIDFDDDNINLQVSNYSIGQNYYGELNKENVDKYNDYVIYNNNRIEEFTIIRKNSIDIKDLNDEMIEEIGRNYYLSINEEEDIESDDFSGRDICNELFTSALETTMLHDDIQKALSHLTDREATIIRLRFGIDDSNIGMSLKEISKEFGLSATRVRQIEAKALRKLRRPGIVRILKPYYID